MTVKFLAQGKNGSIRWGYRQWKSFVNKMILPCLN